MRDILFQYHGVYPTTWAYLSSLLMMGLFFKFGRFWSLRNLDLFLLSMLAPGLLMVQFGGATGPTPDMPSEDPARPATSGDVLHGRSKGPMVQAASARPHVKLEKAIHRKPDLPRASSVHTFQDFDAERLGFVWLFAVGAFLLVRMLFDSTVVRRPLLEPNLSSGGLTFIGCSMFVFLAGNVVSSNPHLAGDGNSKTTQHLPMERGELRRIDSALQPGTTPGIFALLPDIAPRSFANESVASPNQRPGATAAAKVLALLCQLAIVLAVAFVGHFHFGNTKAGVGVAALYLMLPYTVQMGGKIHHLAPAALLVWAVVLYRQPLLAGLFVGLAAGLAYYPVFLLPLWFSFYWRRGRNRFAVGAVWSVAGAMLIVAVNARLSFSGELKHVLAACIATHSDSDGFWGLVLLPAYRAIATAAFVALSATMVFWPAQKNLGSLLSCSAAIMLGTQFWMPRFGGLYMAWYLPLALLVFFRPNLEDRVAMQVVDKGK